VRCGTAVGTATLAAVRLVPVAATTRITGTTTSASVSFVANSPPRSPSLKREGDGFNWIIFMV